MDFDFRVFRTRYADHLLNERHWGSLSLFHKLGNKMRNDFRSLQNSDFLPTAEQYIENFYKSSGGKALLKRMKELAIAESHEILRHKGVERTPGQLSWYNKETFQALIRYEYTPMSPEAHRAFASVMKTNDVFVHKDWIQEGELYGRDYQITDDIAGYEGAGSDIRDTMFQSMFELFDDRMRRWTVTYTDE
jgi:hypothetical protein